MNLMIEVLAIKKWVFQIWLSPITTQKRSELFHSNHNSQLSEHNSQLSEREQLWRMKVIDYGGAWFWVVSSSVPFWSIVSFVPSLAVLVLVSFSWIFCVFHWLRGSRVKGCVELRAFLIDFFYWLWVLRLLGWLWVCTLLIYCFLLIVTSFLFGWLIVGIIFCDID